MSDDLWCGFETILVPLAAPKPANDDEAERFARWCADILRDAHRRDLYSHRKLIDTLRDALSAPLGSRVNGRGEGETPAPATLVQPPHAAGIPQP